MLRYDKISVDTDSCIITYEGKTIALLPQEYRLFLLFLKHPRYVLSYEFIIDNLWKDTGQTPSDSTIRTHIKRLRKAFKKANISEEIIETVHGLGYRLKPLSNHEKEQTAMYLPSLDLCQKFLKIKAIEYIVINTEMTIKFLSLGAKDYCDYPNHLQVGHWVGEAFPELIGLEKTIERITQGKDQSFTLQGVARAANPIRPEYINFYIIAEKKKKSTPQELPLLFVFLEDNSSKMIYRQRLVQQANENYLILEPILQNF